MVVNFYRFIFFTSQVSRSDICLCCIVSGIISTKFNVICNCFYDQFGVTNTLCSVWVNKSSICRIINHSAICSRCDKLCIKTDKSSSISNSMIVPCSQRIINRAITDAKNIIICISVSWIVDYNIGNSCSRYGNICSCSSSCTALIDKGNICICSISITITRSKTLFRKIKIFDFITKLVQLETRGITCTIIIHAKNFGICQRCFIKCQNIIGKCVVVWILYQSIDDHKQLCLSGSLSNLSGNISRSRSNFELGIDTISIYSELVSRSSSNRS